MNISNIKQVNMKARTSPLGAFLRKNALQDSQEMASKLNPKALSPQTPHIFSSLFFRFLFCPLAEPPPPLLDWEEGEESWWWDMRGWCGWWGSPMALGLQYKPPMLPLKVSGSTLSSRSLG